LYPEPCPDFIRSNLRPLRRPRRTGGVALAVYLFAVLASPALHRLHHAVYGDDHVHTPLGMVALPHEQEHVAFDADLAALELAEVATAGTLAVDCALADYTLAECGASALGDHPHNFGDELLARTHRHAPRPFDPTHGAGSPEHLGASLLAARVIVVPPPSLPLIAILSAGTLRSFSSIARFTHAPRGPPLAG
jgi:hypothetical protein